jgi:putative multiple sugar transport system substrate-binding protein
MLTLGLALTFLSACSLTQQGGDASQSTPSGSQSAVVSGETPAAQMTLIGLSAAGEESTTVSSLQQQLQSAGYNVEPAYAKESSDTQISQLRAMVEDDCALILVEAVDAEAVCQWLDTLNDPSLTVVAYGTPLNHSKVAYYLGADYAAMGQAEANALVEQLHLDDEENAPTAPLTLELVSGTTSADELVFQGAMEVLTPYLESGALTVLSGNTTWDTVSTDTPTDYLSEVLSASYLDVCELDALLTIGEDTAAQSIACLQSSYTGSVYPLTVGALGGTASLQAIYSGFLATTTLLPTQEELELSDQAASLIQAVRSGKSAEDVLVEGLTIDQNNFEELLVDTGRYTVDEFDVVSPADGSADATQSEDDTSPADSTAPAEEASSVAPEDGAASAAAPAEDDAGSQN